MKDVSLVMFVISVLVLAYCYMKYSTREDKNTDKGDWGLATVLMIIVVIGLLIAALINAL